MSHPKSTVGSAVGSVVGSYLTGIRTYLNNDILFKDFLIRVLDEIISNRTLNLAVAYALIDNTDMNNNDKNMLKDDVQQEYFKEYEKNFEVDIIMIVSRLFEKNFSGSLKSHIDPNILDNETINIDQDVIYAYVDEINKSWSKKSVKLDTKGPKITAMDHAVTDFHETNFQNRMNTTLGGTVIMVNPANPTNNDAKKLIAMNKFLGQGDITTGVAVTKIITKEKENMKLIYGVLKENYSIDLNAVEKLLDAVKSINNIKKLTLYDIAYGFKLYEPAIIWTELGIAITKLKMFEEKKLYNPKNKTVSQDVQTKFDTLFRNIDKFKTLKIYQDRHVYNTRPHYNFEIFEVLVDNDEVIEILKQIAEKYSDLNVIKKEIVDTFKKHGIKVLKDGHKVTLTDIGKLLTYGF